MVLVVFTLVVLVWGLAWLRHGFGNSLVWFLNVLDVICDELEFDVWC
jgi:hypothetical protein